jgi:hypothetical protein
MGYQKARLGAEPTAMQERPGVRRSHVTDVEDEHGNVVGSTGSAVPAAPAVRGRDCGHRRRQVSPLAASTVGPNGSQLTLLYYIRPCARA